MGTPYYKNYNLIKTIAPGLWGEQETSTVVFDAQINTVSIKSVSLTSRLWDTVTGLAIQHECDVSFDEFGLDQTYYVNAKNPWVDPAPPLGASFTDGIVLNKYNPVLYTNVDFKRGSNGIEIQSTIRLFALQPNDCRVILWLRIEGEYT